MMSNNWNKRATGKVMSFNFIWQTQMQTYNETTTTNKYYYFTSDFECKVCVQRKFEIEIVFKVRCALEYKIQRKEVKNKSVTNVNDMLSTPWAWKQRDYSPIHLHPKKLIQFGFFFNSKELSVFELNGRLGSEMVCLLRIVSYDWLFENEKCWLYWISGEIDRVLLSKTLEALISINLYVSFVIHTQNGTIIPLILLLLLFDWINKTFRY